jgi:hypothetical protein
METKGSGIDKLDVDLRNLLEEALNVEIPAGTYFVSRSRSVQNMVVRTTQVIHLADNDWVDALLDVACANLERDVPNEEDTFTVEQSPEDGELARLMPALQAARVDYDVEQAAVWIVTDNANYGDLGTLVGGFGGRAIGEDDAARAMQIVDEAGIDITQRAVWEDRESIAQGMEDRSLWLWIRGRDLDSSAQGGVWKPIMPTALAQKGWMADFAFSPTGEILVTSICTNGRFMDCREGEIGFWDASSMESLHVAPETDSLHTALTFSADGSLLSSATCTDYRPPDCLDSQIWIWDAASGEKRQVLNGPEEHMSDLLFSPDGRLLAASSCARRDSRRICQEWAVQLWDVSSGLVAHIFAPLSIPAR